MPTSLKRVEDTAFATLLQKQRVINETAKYMTNMHHGSPSFELETEKAKD